MRTAGAGSRRDADSSPPDGRGMIPAALRQAASWLAHHAARPSRPRDTGQTARLTFHHGRKPDEDG
jgi:hypothetical protein